VSSFPERDSLTLVSLPMRRAVLFAESLAGDVKSPSWAVILIDLSGFDILVTSKFPSDALIFLSPAGEVAGTNLGLDPSSPWRSFDSGLSGGQEIGHLVLGGPLMMGDTALIEVTEDSGDRAPLRFVARLLVLLEWDIST